MLNSWNDFLFNSFSFNPVFGATFPIVLMGFVAGCIGLIWRSTNVLMVLIYGELILVSLFLGFVIVAKYWTGPDGYIYALFILNAAAVESAIGLALMLNLYRSNGLISFSSLRQLRG